MTCDTKTHNIKYNAQVPPNKLPILKRLSQAIIMSMIGLVSYAYADVDVKGVGDLEIYKAATGGSVTIAMMIDTSGSMAASDLPDSQRNFSTPINNRDVQCVYDAVVWGGRILSGRIINPTVHNLNVPITRADGSVDSHINLKLDACPLNRYNRVTFTGNVKNLQAHGGNMTRISKLKLGLIGLLADGTALNENHRIAMGNFPTPGKRSGSMHVPAERLTVEHRKKLINFVNKLQVKESTPIGQAYPEVASYMLGTTTNTSEIQSLNSGRLLTGFNESDLSTKNGNVYKSPLNPNAECEGYGIYFLTDGEPNLSSENTASRVMGVSLGITTLDRNRTPKLSNNGVAYPDQSAWESIGTYSQILRDQKKFGKSGLRTATVGFGAVFNGFTNKTMQIPSDDGKLKTVEIPNCDSPGVSPDAKNLCLLGSLDRDFGKGGFTATGKPEDIARSVTNFISQLEQQIEASPSGTISIPKDPLSTRNIQPYAYLPMLQSEPAKNSAVWAGNLKKYHTLNGTLYGADGTTRLYQKDTNRATQENREYPFAFNPQAKDIWQKTGAGANSLNLGGTKTNIPVPNTSNSQRSVYVEVNKTVQNNQQPTKVLQKVAISSGKLVDFDKLDGYDYTDKAYIVNHLGYPIPTEQSQGNPYTSDQQIEGAIKTVTPTKPAFLGGVLHSVPVLASYKGVFEGGNITSDENKRDDNLLYGSMDGALHMVGAKDGVEQFSFIPRAMFENTTQRLALKAGTTNGKIGVPAFGVDAPWEVNAIYNIDDNLDKANSVVGSKITAKKMYAYGGLRMGGEGIFGLDISDKTNPTLLFSHDKKTPNFDRIGQIWSKPLVTNIRQNNKNKQVIIFGGGYDMCYEDPNFNLGSQNNNTNTVGCKTKTEMQGNAVYMLDAITGDYITHWSTTDNAAMKHSIVAEINGIDRNNDGAVDHLYVADLGGQIFRMDLNDNRTGSSIKRKTTLIFNANKDVSQNRLPHIPYRFYERPIVSFYNDGGSRFGVINISTGDRSSPLSKHRSVDDANRIYGIFDKDIAQPDIVKRSLVSQNLGNGNLVAIDTKKIDAGGQTASNVKQMIDQMRPIGTANKHGWYHTMDRFSGFINVPYLKAVGPGLVTSSVYYTSIYSPEYQYSQGNTCSAGIEGGTERQMYCLPWGICADPTTGNLAKSLSVGGLTPSKNGTLGFAKAGPGIQELARTTVTSQKGKSSTEGFRTIISHLTDQEQNDPNITRTFKGGSVAGSGLENSANKNNVTSGSGTGADTVGQPFKNRPIYKFKVQRWYDLQDAENN